MVQAHAPTRTYSPVRLTIADSAAGFFTLLFFAVIVFAGITQLNPPDAVPSGAPITEFSSGRAMEHLEVIAQNAHPIGSPEQGLVRSYILKELAGIGLSPEVQKAEVAQTRTGPPFTAGTVQNIVARLRGRSNDRAVLLVGHYDSVSTGPGASDDGSAVAAILETLRALVAGPPLKNDVIALFSDGEEVGLLGAKAFVDEHPWAKDVGVVLNFDARGTSGPSIMFETSRSNGWLIREFAESASHAVANSFSSEIYKHLPNDTDLSIFKEAGFAGLNFAYIRGLVNYHTELDNLENIDQRSLQHQGLYALALTRQFGNATAEAARQHSAVYFSALGPTLFVYSDAWVIPLAILVSILFAAVFALGAAREHVSFVASVKAFLAFLAGLVIVLLVTMLLQLIFYGNGYNEGVYVIGFGCVTVGILAGLYKWFRTRLTRSDMAMGGLAVWLVLMISSSFMFPGASYLFAWPLLFMLAALGYVFAAKKPAAISVKEIAILCLCAVPGLVLISQAIYLIFIALGVSSAVIVSGLVAVLLGSLVLHLDSIVNSTRWAAPAVAAGLGIAFILWGGLSSGFGPGHPKPNSILYALNADTAKAIWASADRNPDTWTAQFLSSDTERGPLPDYLPLSPRRFLKSSAPPATFSAPTATMLDDRQVDDIRTMQVRLASPRGAPIISVYVESGADIVAAAIDGKAINTVTPDRGRSGDLWGVRYYGLPNDGIVLTLKTMMGKPVTLRVIDQTYGLPQLSGTALKARPESMMAARLPYNDSTFVTKSFVF
jgi:hypothetical protein